MKNLFLPYELALIAKEKGFDEPCLAKYVNFIGHDPQCLIYKNSIFGENHLGKNTDEDINNSVAQDCTAPLYQQIIDWFREKYNIHIHLTRVYEYSKTPREFSGWCIYIDNGIENSNLQCNNYFIKTYFSNYYEALNFAIEEAFKLI